VAEALALELTADEHALFAEWFAAAGA